MEPVLALILVVALIGLNGLFVASEFALVSVSRGVIEERAGAGDRRARMVLREVTNLSFVLSSAQFGITVTSLLVGFLAEPAIGDTVIRPMLDVVGLTEASATAVAVSVAFFVSTVVQMIVGELAPKNLAIARPESTALAVAVPMRAFQILFGPVIRIFDRAAAWVSGRVFGIEVREELVAGHSLDELSRIVAVSGEEGSLSEEQADLLGRAVELGDTHVSHVMVPRPDVVWLDRDATLDDLRAAAGETGHSRFPVRGEGEDDVVGTVHIKDLLQVDADRRAETAVAEIAAAPMLVPESETIRRLFARFRRGHRTFAVVVDEYGGTAGIVTVEDLVEELVGEIEDEFDQRSRGAVRRTGPRRFAVAGTLRVDDAARLLGMDIPPGDYESVAGFVIDGIDRIPEEGDSVLHEGWRFIVTRMDGVRVVELRVEAPSAVVPGEGSE